MTADDVGPALMPSSVRFSVTRYSGAAVFHVLGELDTATASELRAELAGAAGEAAVLLDLTGVRLIDSVGLGTLLGAIRAVHEQGGRVAAVGGPEATMALRAAGVDRILFLADSPGAGLRWLLETPRYEPTSGDGVDESK